METLTAGDVTVGLRPEVGGRIASIVVGGEELLVTEADRPIDWGMFPMAPFAGRVAEGSIAFDGVAAQLPLTLPPHAIHGTLVTREWEYEGDGVMTAELSDPWPWRGRVRHEVALGEGGLTARLVVEADEPMPAWVGWHPWLKRHLTGGRHSEFAFDADQMFEKGPTGLPTGRLVDVPPGPWDDCFSGVRWPVQVTWPGALQLEIDSDCDYLVVFDEPEHGFCIEPQSAPPDALGLGMPTRLEPGAPLVAVINLRWRAHDL